MSIPQPGPEPQPSPGQQMRDVQDRLNEQAEQEAGNKFISMEDVQEIIFGKPTGNGDYLAQVWTRLNVTPGYKQQKEWIVGQMRTIAHKMAEALGKRARGVDSVRADTAEKLDALMKNMMEKGGKSALHGYFAATGRALNRDETYGLGEGPIQPKDVAALQAHVDAIAAMNVEEVIAVVFDSQDFIQMLKEQSSGAKDGMLDPANPKYQENLGKLCDLAAGKTMPGEKPKSEFRKTAEGTLWLEILRSSSCRMHRDMIKMFLERNSFAQTQKFLADCMIAGAMDRKELLDMYDAQPDAMAKFGTRGEFDKFLKSAARIKVAVEDKAEKAAEEIQYPQTQSAVRNWLTFNFSFVELAGRCATLSAVFTAFTMITQKINESTDRSWKGLIAAGVEGAKDAVKSPHVIGGTALAAICANHVSGGRLARKYIYGPSGGEKEKITQTSEGRFVDEIARNHHETYEYFADNYDRYLGIAKQNENNVNPKQKPDENRGVFDLYLGDVQLTDEQAGKLGYENKAEAIAVLHRLFNISAKVFKAENKQNLIKYLADRGLRPGSVHSFS